MTRFIERLRKGGNALVARCATMMLRRRMRRAQAQLSLEVRAKAPFWRARYLVREERLQRERTERYAGRQSRTLVAPDAPAGQTLDKNEVLAAIARGRARREARMKSAREQDKR